MAKKSSKPKRAARAISRQSPKGKVAALMTGALTWAQIAARTKTTVQSVRMHGS